MTDLDQLDHLRDLRDRLCTCIEAEGNPALAQELRQRWEQEVEA